MLNINPNSPTKTPNNQKILKESNRSVSVSPEDIMPIPKCVRVVNKKRKSRCKKSAILTSTPEKEKLKPLPSEETVKSRKKKKCKRKISYNSSTSQEKKRKNTDDELTKKSKVLKKIDKRRDAKQWEL